MKNSARIPPKINRGVHMWIIAIIMDFFIVIYNSNFINISAWFPWSSDIIAAHGAELLVFSFIFVIPIIYASYVYGLRGTLLTWFVFLIGIAPRTALEVHTLEDGIKFGLFAVVALLLGLLVSLWISALRHEKALVEKLTPKRWNSIARILKVQENERKRLARELHDDTIQDLLVIVNHLHALETGIHGELPRETRNRVERVENEILHVIESMRKMSQGLRTSVLDNTGLVPAVRWLAETMSQETGIKVDVTVNGKPHKMKPEVEILIFRIVQEALSNVKQHSKATEAQIMLDFAAKDIKMTVQDNGCGFVPPTDASEDIESSQLGLDIIKQRAKLLGGSLNIQSERGKGTVLTVETGLV